MLKVYLCVILFGGLFNPTNYTNPFIFLKKYNMKDTKTEEFYTRLQEQLKGDTTWPAPYLYKFIVPGNAQKIAQIEAIFNGTNAQINTRDSSKGTYTSLSIKVVMASPEMVIEKYKQVSQVEGVISL
jgi:putative lipoic acid-binding regulatory protein|tara:strand:+ start:1439 stop:1819 length:381 start_codon:yes stop_codon:yes gene_type:complete